MVVRAQVCDVAKYAISMVQRSRPPPIIDVNAGSLGAKPVSIMLTVGFRQLLSTLRLQAKVLSIPFTHFLVFPGKFEVFSNKEWEMT